MFVSLNSNMLCAPMPLQGDFLAKLLQGFFFGQNLFQVCVYLKGKRVVDLAASSVDPAYTADSLQVCTAGTTIMNAKNNKATTITTANSETATTTTTKTTTKLKHNYNPCNHPDHLELNKELDGSCHGLSRGQRSPLLLGQVSIKTSNFFTPVDFSLISCIGQIALPQVDKALAGVWNPGWQGGDHGGRCDEVQVFLVFFTS